MYTSFIRDSVQARPGDGFERGPVFSAFLVEGRVFFEEDEKG